MEILSPYILIISILTSCQEKDNYIGFSLHNSDSLRINSKIPDSIKTGIVIPCTPIMVYADSVKPPVIKELKGSTKKLTHSNTAIVDSLLTFEIISLIKENNSIVQIDTAQPTLIPCKESKAIPCSSIYLA